MGNKQFSPPSGFPETVEYGRQKYFFDTVAPITRDGVYKRADPKTGTVYHVLLVRG